MDYGERLLQGFQVGAGLAGQMQRTAESRQRIAEAESLFPIKKTILTQERDLQAEKLRIALTAKEDEIKGMKTVGDVTALQANLGNMSVDEGYDAAGNLVDQNKYVLHLPQFQFLMKTLDSARTFKEKDQDRKERLENARIIWGARNQNQKDINQARIDAIKNAPTREIKNTLWAQQTREQAQLAHDAGDEERALSLEGQAERLDLSVSRKATPTVEFERLIENQPEEIKAKLKLARAHYLAGEMTENLPWSSIAKFAMDLPELMKSMKKLKGKPEGDYLEEIVNMIQNKTRSMGNNPTSSPSGLSGPTTQWDKFLNSFPHK